MPEVRIKTDYGEIVVPFTTISDLETGLKDIEKVNQIVNTNVGKIKRKPKVKTGFEDIYLINDDDSVSILKPGEKTENVGIVLFAYDPIPMKILDVKNYSGVKNAKENLNQAKYFDNVGKGLYKLNSTGLAWLVNSVFPKLRKNKKEE